MRFYYFLILIIFTSCSSLKLIEPEPEPERQTIVGKPLTFSTETGLFSTDSSGLASSGLSNSSLSFSTGKFKSNGIPVNSLLWRASLDIIDFMPLSLIDVNGGFISTDWYINSENNQVRFKVKISFSNPELRASSFKVSVIREKIKNGVWVSDGSSEGLARKLEELVLTRARELRQKK